MKKNTQMYEFIIQPRGYGKRYFLMCYILVKFTQYVELHPNKHKKLRDYVNDFVKHAIDNKLI